MPDARLHFRSPAWQSLPVAGLPPATSPGSAQPTPAFLTASAAPVGMGEAYQGRALSSGDRKAIAQAGEFALAV
jgi:hypothetical protein